MKTKLRILEIPLKVWAREVTSVRKVLESEHKAHEVDHILRDTLQTIKTEWIHDILHGEKSTKLLLIRIGDSTNSIKNLAF